jgi:hypothetical protein
VNLVTQTVIEKITLKNYFFTLKSVSMKYKKEIFLGYTFYIIVSLLFQAILFFQYYKNIELFILVFCFILVIPIILTSMIVLISYFLNLVSFPSILRREIFFRLYIIYIMLYFGFYNQFILSPMNSNEINFIIILGFLGPIIMIFIFLVVLSFPFFSLMGGLFQGPLTVIFTLGYLIIIPLALSYIFLVIFSNLFILIKYLIEINLESQS